jgi:NTP pyrophosphatase (non-canonical NTP hydrolase)
MDNNKVDQIQAAIRAEVDRAQAKYPSFNSTHEGYAVLLEEVDELWDEVKKNSKNQDMNKMRTEALQVAAMAVRFLVELT